MAGNSVVAGSGLYYGPSAAPSDPSANANLLSSTTQAEASKYAALKNLQGTQYSSDVNQRIAQLQSASANLASQRNLQGTQYSSDAAKQAQLGVANTQAGAANLASLRNLQGTQYSSDVARQAQEAVAGIQAGAASNVAGLNLAGTQYSADKNLASTKYASDQNLAGNRYASDQSRASASEVATTQAGAATGVAGLNLQGTRYASDQGLAGTQYAQNAETARQQTALAANQARFNQLFPLFTDTLKTAGAGQTSLGYPQLPPPPTGGGGPAGSGPVTGLAAPVLSADQVQQQVNSAHATNDLSAAGQAKRATSEAGGRGVGANSPLAMALRNQVYGRNLATNADTERQTRLAARQMNADDARQRDIAGLQAGTQRYASDQSLAGSAYNTQGNYLGAQVQADAEKSRNQNQLLAALFNSLSNFNT